MATESGANGPSSSSAESFIGCFISLISKCEIRYEGVLYFLNIQDSTIGLKNVRSYGTEGRKKDGPQVPSSDKVYEYILFRGNDIKNLQIKSPTPSSKSEEQVFSDPAVIQSEYSGLRSSPVGELPSSPVAGLLSSPVASVGGRSLTESIQRQDSPAISSKAFPSGLPSHQSVTQLGPSNLSDATQVASHPSFSAAMYWQGPSGISSSSYHSLLQSSSLHPTSLAASLVVQNQMQNAETQFSSTLQDINSIQAQISGNICPDPRPIHPQHSVHRSAPSYVDSTSGSLPTATSLLTPDQFAYPREQLLSLSHLNPTQKDMGSLTLTSSGSSALIPSPASQAPLLPLPTSVQKPPYTAPQYTEEFDFEAMNEKFKKDEVWGSLGKTTTKIEGVANNASLSLGDRECHGVIPNPKTAYKKDDFFDTISCNSLTHGSRNGQNRFSERMKQDTETFGNFQQRPNFTNGGYGAGRGANFRGSNNWGRGYGYNGRGRGPNFPF
ncbi:hypothetical protein AAZX31_01G140400 [Glycine max]